MSATFFPPVGGAMAIAIIDPSKQRGEEGQYTRITGTVLELNSFADQAKEKGMEVRFYYEHLKAAAEVVASKIIVTWIPPGHVQPFHTHHRVHEMTLMTSGAVLAVDSDVINENELRQMVGSDELLELGRLISVGEMVIEGPGIRHTIVNPTKEYATMVTVQTARMGIDQFDSDWHTDKPVGAVAA